MANHKKIHKIYEEHEDVELKREELEERVMTVEEMVGLIWYSYYHLLKLHASFAHIRPSFFEIRPLFHHNMLCVSFAKNIKLSQASHFITNIYSYI